jgi:hypothetical protein
MTDTDILKIMALAGPFILLVMALGVVWFTRRQDRRADHRRAK